MNFVAHATAADQELYWNGQQLYEDQHLMDHIDSDVPVQVYCNGEHSEIGFIEQFCADYVKINNVFYSRKQFTFVSRPGY